METRILNYRILISSEKHVDTGKNVYNAYCPTLGVADWGKTVEEALHHIKGAIECHIESLVKHGKSIPTEAAADVILALTSVSLPKQTPLTFA